MLLNHWKGISSLPGKEFMAVRGTQEDRGLEYAT